MDTSGPPRDEASESDRLARLERLMRETSGRLAALEQAGAAVPLATSAAASPESLPPASAVMPSPPWANDPAALGGQVGPETTFSYAGSGQFGRGRMVMRKTRRLADVLDADPDLLAKVFTGLASPARIVLLRALLNGSLSSQQLRRELDDASAGQLYHHLKELQAAGLVIQQGRSLYALPQGSQIALCFAIIAAVDLTASWPRYPVAGADPPEQQAPEGTASVAEAAGDGEPDTA
jgi:biotin operon repressor